MAKGSPWFASPWKTSHVGKLYSARVRRDGRVLFNRIIYSSPTMAGKAICNHAVNGWQFWECERGPGD